MSDHRYFRVGAAIPSATREMLLRMFPPKFPNRVWCATITAAYMVTKEFRVNSGPTRFTIWGHHVGEDHEALAVRVGGSMFRLDGRHFFIALSSAMDVTPMQCGEFTSGAVRQLESPVEFVGRWRRYFLREAVPTDLAA